MAEQGARTRCTGGAQKLHGRESALSAEIQAWITAVEDSVPRCGPDGLLAGNASGG